MLEKIDRVGWMVQIVAADADNPTFAYTIGAVQKLGSLLPGELLLVGIPDYAEAARVLNWVLSQVTVGVQPLQLGFSDHVFAAGVRAYLGRVKPEFLVPEWFGVGLWFARTFDSGTPYNAIQIVWPTSTSGRFPWQVSSDDPVHQWLGANQPMLCDPPSGDEPTPADPVTDPRLQ